MQFPILIMQEHCEDVKQTFYPGIKKSFQWAKNLKEPKILIKSEEPVRYAPLEEIHEEKDADLLELRQISSGLSPLHHQDNEINNNENKIEQIEELKHQNERNEIYIEEDNCSPEKKDLNENEKAEALNLEHISEDKGLKHEFEQEQLQTEQDWSISCPVKLDELGAITLQNLNYKYSRIKFIKLNRKYIQGTYFIYFEEENVHPQHKIINNSKYFSIKYYQKSFESLFGCIDIKTEKIFAWNDYKKPHILKVFV
jgi:hypothetical protein